MEDTRPSFLFNHLLPQSVTAWVMTMNNLLIGILNGMNSLAAGVVIVVTVIGGFVAFSQNQNTIGLGLLLGGPMIAGLLFGTLATLLDIRHQLVQLNSK